MMLLAALLAVLVIAGGAAFVTWKSELWGGRSLPDPASIAAAHSGSSTTTNEDGSAAVMTDDMVAALKAKGFNTRIKQVFSGKSKGVFIGYAGNANGKEAKPGARMPAGATIIVQESAGPGVPKDTIGKQAKRAASTLESMGVPVHYKQVYVSDTEKTPEGSVVDTYPAAGSPVPDNQRDDGIYVGVAVQGTGPTMDIVGQDVDTVRTELESQGYSVSVEPRFAAESLKGKVTGSNPAPGSHVDAGQSVTLYEGVDASDVDKLMIDDPSKNVESGVRSLYGMSAAMAGTYCKATVTDADKDCMTIDYRTDEYGSIIAYQTWGTKANDNPSRDDEVSQCFATNGGDVGRCSITLTYGSDTFDGDATNRLITKGWGMFDFGRGQEGALCGGETITTWFMNCRAGESTYPTTGDDLEWDGSATYEMSAIDLFVYVTAGADIDAAEQSGYFDTSAVQTAAKQKPVDTDRPFILYRDPSLYDEDQTSVKVNEKNMYDNPFVPSSKDTNDVKFKPAPSDETAYYLVDQVNNRDWNAMRDADLG
ncbi:PASTA domain-containing protein [Bifidobacterium goeldii]|nr:PASTA domain-containing protein [Bifidobacterium goeldii]